MTPLWSKTISSSNSSKSKTHIFESSYKYRMNFSPLIRKRRSETLQTKRRPCSNRLTTNSNKLRRRSPRSNQPLRSITNSTNNRVLTHSSWIRKSMTCIEWANSKTMKKCQKRWKTISRIKFTRKWKREATRSKWDDNTRGTSWKSLRGSMDTM